jgi:hypothetical protein
MGESIHRQLFLWELIKLTNQEIMQKCSCVAEVLKKRAIPSNMGFSIA